MSNIAEPDVPTYGDWRASPQTVTERLEPWRAAALAATLQSSRPEFSDGVVLPPLWHWLYFLDAVPQSNIGVDGHPKRGGFLPPVTLPRRMFAGTELTINQPLTLGEECTRRSVVSALTEKKGRSGELVFVSVDHEFSDPLGGSMHERQTVVYREAGGPAAQGKAMEAHNAPWSHEYQSTEALLFRYSALTFNAHRIHYDRDYATAEEGYPNLVVHGPLLATRMAELAYQFEPTRSVNSFSFQAASPTFVDETYQVCGQPLADQKVDIWVESGGTARVRGALGFS